MKNKNIPNGWKKIKLKDCCVNKGEYGLNAPGCEYALNLPKYIRITDIDENGNYSKKDITYVNDNNSSNFLLKEGDIIFARTGATVGKTYMYKKSDGVLAYAGFLIKFSIDISKYNVYFIYSLFQTNDYKKWIVAMSARSGQPGINAQEYGSYELIVPAVEEQRRIADILGECDRVIELKQKLINEEEKRKKYLMSVLLNPKSGVRLPGFSDPWKSAKLGELGIFSKGGNLSKENINGKKYPCILYGNLYTHYQETIKKIYFYTDNEDCVYGYKNDLLFPTSTTVDGDSLISPSVILVDKIALGGDIIKLSLNNNFSGLFLSYYINGPYKKQMAKVAQGSTIIHLQKKHIENMKVNFPTIEEQKAIADILSSQDSKIDLLKKELEEWKTKKKSLMQLLLTGLVRTNGC